MNDTANDRATVYTFPRKHDRLLDKRETARELTIGVRTLERMVADEQIPSLMIRGQRRFRWSDVDRLKREGTD